MASVLKQTIDSEELRGLQHEWASLPMTRRMLQCIRERFGATGLPASQRMEVGALYYSGRVDTCEGIIRFLDDFGAEADLARAMKKFDLKPPTYGADVILRQEGYSDAEIQGDK
jgi:hypothetical protein